MDDIAQRIKHEVPPDLLPQGDTDLLFRMYAVLALSLGEGTGAASVHDAWSAWMSQSDPEHESIQPFDKLSENVQSQDEPYAKAIRKVAAGLEPDGTPRKIDTAREAATKEERMR